MLMDFDLPADLVAYLAELDAFIDAEITPLEQADDNIRFFDHRREWARTDFENGGLPRHEWEELLTEATRRADAAGHWRFSAPKKYGGKDGSNLWMAVIREHFAAKGLGLHNDLQNEHSIVGNFPFVAMFEHFGTPEQQQEFIFGGFERRRRVAFGLTEPEHGSDATHMETRAVRETRDGVPGWRIDGEKMWTTGMHVATHCATFARTSGQDGKPRASPASSCPIPPTGW
jgi:alkylation response protein AidB-like acyl-CoA dehydrogenase